MNTVQRYLVYILTPIAFAVPALAQNRGNPGYVCEEINPDTGQCESWREIYLPPNQQGRPGSGYYSYENDYRRPPPQARRPSKGSVPPGSAIMPSTEYAPGFGTSFPPPPDFGTKIKP